MAGIDKIYGTYEQGQQLRQWLKRHRPKALRCLYPAYPDEPRDEILPLSNFRHSDDSFLARKCPIDFVLERLHEQYGQRKIGRIAHERHKAPRP